MYTVGGEVILGGGGGCCGTWGLGFCLVNSKGEEVEPLRPRLYYKDL